MVHKNRKFRVIDIATAEELARKLMGHTWTGCTGWRLNNLLFLNDSFSEDSAQEYAIFRDNKQIESITFGWCGYDKSLEYINGLLNGSGVEPFFDLPESMLDHPKGSCYLCA